MSMEEESYLRLLLTSSPPALLDTPSGASPSQASPLVSAIPTGQPPAPRI